MWLPDAEDNFNFISSDDENIRLYLKELPFPSEPLLSQLFVDGRLKLFGNPQKVQGADEIYAHIAAMWGGLFCLPAHELIRWADAANY
jgi:hypothetical protein